MITSVKEKALQSKEEKFETNWDAKFIMLHLDKDIYYHREDMTTFILVSKSELKEIKKKTLERMLSYNRNIKSKCGFTDEDIEKLRK